MCPSKQRPFTGPIGDPHVFTLDGDRFDVYENGTFSLFQYSGQKIAHPSAASEVDWRLYAHYGGPWWLGSPVVPFTFFCFWVLASLIKCPNPKP